MRHIAPIDRHTRGLNVSQGACTTVLKLTCVMPVRAWQNADSWGRHVGLTKLRNSSTISRTRALPLGDLSFHRSKQTGHSCGMGTHGQGVDTDTSVIATCDDLVWIVKACSLDTRCLDIEDQESIVQLSGASGHLVLRILLRVCLSRRV